MNYHLFLLIFFHKGGGSHAFTHECTWYIKYGGTTYYQKAVEDDFVIIANFESSMIPKRIYICQNFEVLFKANGIFIRNIKWCFVLFLKGQAHVTGGLSQVCRTSTNKDNNKNTTLDTHYLIKSKLCTIK